MSMNLQCQSFIRHCAQHAKQGVVAKLDCGVVLAWTRSNFRFLNGFFLATTVVDEQDLRWRLDEIKQYIKQMKPSFAWALFIEPEWLPLEMIERSKEICSVAGFILASDFKCMQARDLLQPVRSLPEAEISFATCNSDIYNAALLNLQAYHMEESVAETIVNNHALVTDFDKQFCCLVSINSTPVATATTVVLDKCLYVALVATSTQHRMQRNGIHFI
ncbi:unnamed protein product [Adineta steineri]|uniref:Uncharacterized protein n=1 Tax=Adineta steineri TaxID=433720 RepID=A0A816AKS7_9BILA|nr:unnamed protein product [Adineta steineri]CAF1598914.1 unnamed protein product [Adineta steineri]